MSPPRRPHASMRPSSSKLSDVAEGHRSVLDARIEGEPEEELRLPRRTTAHAAAEVETRADAADLVVNEARAGGVRGYVVVDGHARSAVDDRDRLARTERKEPRVHPEPHAVDAHPFLVARADMERLALPRKQRARMGASKGADEPRRRDVRPGENTPARMALQIFQSDRGDRHGEHRFERRAAEEREGIEGRRLASQRR